MGSIVHTSLAEIARPTREAALRSGKWLDSESRNRCNQAARAAEPFGRALAASPLVETAWLLGDACGAAGDAKGAEEAYARVERDGRRVDPRTLSLFLSTKNKDASEALRLAREEYAFAQRHLYGRHARVGSLSHGGCRRREGEHRARARLGTPDLRLVYHEGAIRMAAGETKAGRMLVAKAMAMNPAFDVDAVKEARAIMAAN
jgi:hypothetical protein